MRGLLLLLGWACLTRPAAAANQSLAAAAPQAQVGTLTDPHAQRCVDRCPVIFTRRQSLASGEAKAFFFSFSFENLNLRLTPQLVRKTSGAWSGRTKPSPSCSSSAAACAGHRRHFVARLEGVVDLPEKVPARTRDEHLQWW